MAGEMDRKKDWGGGKMRRVQSGGRDGQKKKRLGRGKYEKGPKWRERWTKKKKKDWGGGKNEEGRKWRERWTKKKGWGGGNMRRVPSGGRDGQKKKRLGRGKDEKGRKWRERWTEKKTGEGER